jgi:hypothetical protein
VHAAWYVADRALEMVTHTTASQPSSAAAANASRKAPGDGAEVSGSSAEAAHFAQNSSVLKSLITSGPSLPSLTSSSTTTI